MEIAKAKQAEGPEVYEKCEFNSLYTECKPINLECSQITDTTKCSSCKTSNRWKKSNMMEVQGARL
jgi:hypothetical protein